MWKNTNLNTTYSLVTYRNSGFAFVPNPLIYGPCRPSQLSHYFVYKSGRGLGPDLRFLDVEQPNAPRHPMFDKDEQTGLKRLSRNEMQEKELRN